MSKKDIREMMKYNLEYMEARMSEEEFGGDYTSSVDLKYANKEIERLQQENKQLKAHLEMQKDSNKLLCKAIMCDDCDCNVCEAHKQQIKLQEQLKQRDEVIDKAINDINLVIELIKQQPTNDDSWILDRLNSFIYILQKYKGDNNE